MLPVLNHDLVSNNELLALDKDQILLVSFARG